MSNKMNESILSIECEDIVLREWLASDFETFHALTWQPEIYQLLPGWNVSRETRSDWFNNYELPGNKDFLKAVTESGNVENHMLRLAITLKETREFIGWCCSGIKDELPEPNREIMYAISVDHRGKGFTTQAAKAMTSYLFNYTDIEVLNAVALLDNTASNRVIQKAGYILQGNIKIEGEEYFHYQAFKNEWFCD